MAARDESQCAPGTAFYVCQLNNFRGCCSVDPCALTAGCPDKQPDSPDKQPDSPDKQPDSCPGTQPDTNPEDKQPDTKPDEQPDTCGKDGTNRVYNPGMRIVGKDGPQTNDFNVKKSAEKTQEQDMYFSLPAKAKECSLRWGVPAADEREFTVKESGLVNVSKVDADGNVVDDIGAGDFTNWDILPEEQDGHVVGGFDCEADPVFRLQPANIGEVFIAQNDNTGWYVEYKC